MSEKVMLMKNYLPPHSLEPRGSYPAATLLARVANGGGHIVPTHGGGRLMLRDREMGVLIHVCDYFSRYICDTEM